MHTCIQVQRRTSNLSADRLAQTPSLNADEHVKLHDHLCVVAHVCTQALVTKQWNQATVSHLRNVAWPESLLSWMLAGRVQSADCW